MAVVTVPAASRWSVVRRGLLVLVTVVAVLPLMLGVTSMVQPAHAEPGDPAATDPDAATAGAPVSVDYVQVDGTTLNMLVAVPTDDPIDHAATAVSLAGEPVMASSKAATGAEVQRTTVLAIDTSNSMRGERIAGAVEAATLFLETVPDDVRVGILTFDNDVTVRQKPSLDRAESHAVLAGLTLKRRTALYEAVDRAVEIARAAPGQSQVLVLSDGKDNTGTPLEPLLTTIADSGVTVDVVALGLNARATRIAESMVEAGNGELIPANDSEQLREAFRREAAVLSRQVLVTATVPDAVAATSAEVEVRLTAGGTTHAVNRYIQLTDPDAATAGDAPAVAAMPTAASGWLDHNVPSWLMWVGVGAILIAALTLAILVVGGNKTDRGEVLDSHLRAYGLHRGTADQMRQSLQFSAMSEQAKEAVEKALASNAGFEQKVSRRLDGAGSALKAAEWLLIHVGIVLGAGLVGLLAGKGHPLILLLALVAGAVGPWLYLGFRRSRRLQAFDASLADTLQLMSGSLSAGLSLSQAVDAIVDEGSEPNATEFRRVIVEARLGVPIEDALEAVADRMDSKDFAWVVMSIRIQREVGGNLAELLLTVAETIREREYIRRHVAALSAEGRLSAWILGGLPIVFLIYLTLTQPKYINPMFAEPLGWLMLGGSGLLLSVGFVWMMKVAKVEV